MPVVDPKTPKVQKKSNVKQPEIFEEPKESKEQKPELVQKKPVQLTEEQKKDQAIAKVNHSEYTKYEGVSQQMISVLTKTICKEFTLAEIYYYLNVCHELQMSPHLKLIWAFKDTSGKVVIFAGRDGFLYNARRSPKFRGLESAEIRAKDTFKPDMATGKVLTHTFDNFSDRGEVVGSWAICKRHDEPDRLVVLHLDDYKKGSWKNIPAMIKKCAETEVLKKQFPLYGVENEYDWVINNGVAERVPVGQPNSVESSEDLDKEFYNNRLQELLDLCDKYNGRDKIELVKTIRDLIKKKKLTLEMIESNIAFIENKQHEEEE